MKFFIIVAAALPTIILAALAEGTTTVTKPSDESHALQFLLTNSPPGHQAKEDEPAPEGCYWDGTAPFCDGSCPTGYTEENRGSCSDGACCWRGYKALCCRDHDGEES